jgi:NAD(P)-dependent dehydrogenase (short-subunit alcohol dehydrogenase family)
MRREPPRRVRPADSGVPDGAIVTTGSIESKVIALGGSAASYAASKGGALQLIKQIAVDCGPQGIRAGEAAAVALFLLSGEASFMTASAVTVDGGYTSV